MNKVIKIEDYPCGSGKTTRMIENFKEGQKYLVIVPLLSEINRVTVSGLDITKTALLEGRFTTQMEISSVANTSKPCHTPVTQRLTKRAFS